MPLLKTLGENCKFFEENFGNGKYLMNQVPALCRIDGKTFHTFTKNLRRPYDPDLSQLMIETTKFLAEKCLCNWAYCQSDEISLCWFTPNEDTQIYFDGRRQKIESVTAALATAYFNKMLPTMLPSKADELPIFDSRAWSVPTLEQAAKYLRWRQIDATKNAITMAASHYYSHNELHGKNSKSKNELLWNKRVNFNDYPAFFRRGTFVRRIKQERTYSTDEIDKLPAKHAARTNPALLVERTVVEVIDMPPLSKVVNQIGVLFNGETPQTLTGE